MAFLELVVTGFNVKGRLAREFEITFHPCNKMPAKNTFKQWKKIKVQKVPLTVYQEVLKSVIYSIF